MAARAFLALSMVGIMAAQYCHEQWLAYGRSGVVLSMVGVMAAQFLPRARLAYAARAFAVILSMVGILAALIVSYCERGWHIGRSYCELLRAWLAYWPLLL